MSKEIHNNQTDTASASFGVEKFYDLIPSKAVRQHCIETHCKLSPLDCICLVHDCDTISIEKKHSLYNDIMKSIPEPEFSVSLSENTEEKLSVYRMLKRYINAEKGKIKLFLENSESQVFDAWGFPLMSLHDTVKTWKQSIFKSDKTATVRNNSTNVSVRLFQTGEIESVYINTQYKEIFNFAPKLSIPFKKGDLLNYNEYGDRYTLRVFDSLCKDALGQFAIVYCYDLCNLSISQEKVSCSKLDYIDETKCSDNSLQNKKLYILLSDFLKGTIGVDTFANSYLYGVKEFEFSQSMLYTEDEYFIKFAQSRKEV